MKMQIWILMMMLASGAALASGYVETEIGIGYNSNVYRTPNKNYQDLASTLLPFPPQNLQTGAYVPLDLKAGFSPGANPDITLRYKFDGDFYLDSNLSNGGYSQHDLSANLHKKTGRGKKRREFEGNFFIHDRNKDYYDRDTGDNKTNNAGDEDLSERFSYRSVGFDAEYLIKSRPWEYGIVGEFEDRDYGDIIAQSQYDYKKILLGFSGEYRFSRGNKLKIRFDHATTDYSDRKARDRISGNTTATLLTYVYNELEFSLRNKLSPNWTSRLNYTLIDRVDDFDGYNDRLRHKVSVSLINRSGRLRTKLRFSYTVDDYANAFAFEDPAGGAKDYDLTLLDVNTSYRLSKKTAFVANLGYWDSNTNDTRYDYERFRFETGVKWEM